jgi:hypothetical protein
MTKISALSDIGTSVASNDTFVLVDVSDPTTPNKKIQQQNLFLIPDGSAGTPAVRFLNDTDVGLFRPTTNTLALATGGSERLRIDSSGQVGIGTSSPGALLDLTATAGAGGQTSVIRFGLGAAAESYIGVANAAGNIIANSAQGDTVIRNDGGKILFSTDSGTTAHAVIDSSGRLGIGTTSPAAQLNVSQSTGSSIVKLNGLNGYDLLVSNTQDSGTLYDFNIGSGSGAFSFTTSAGERARIDSSGRLLVGTPSARANFYNSTNSAHFQIEGSGSNDNYALSIVSNYAGNTSGAQVILAKSGGSSVGDNTLVSDGNTIGQINFQGADGTEFVEAAKISAEIDGTPGANDMPGRLVFSTTADGASSPTERMRITSDAYVRLASGTGGIQFNGDTAAANALDDYEEGTWTPSLGGTATYNYQQGNYTKIGRFVYIRGALGVATLGTGKCIKSYFVFK